MVVSKNDRLNKPDSSSVNRIPILPALTQILRFDRNEIELRMSCTENKDSQACLALLNQKCQAH